MNMRSSLYSWRAVRKGLLLCWFGALAFSPSFAGEIILPSPALERDRLVLAVYRTGSLATGKGELSVKWTDVYGRVVEDRKIPFELTDESEVRFPLDLRRAVAMHNDLSVHFSFEGVNRKGAPDRRQEDARVSFVARPPDRTWWDYAIIMWQDQSPQGYAALKPLGISAAMYGGKSQSLPEALLQNDLRWYEENIATDFYSAYHRWFPDRPVNWKFKEAKELYKKDPTSLEAFKRHPSLVDPEWLRKIHDRLVECARINSPYRPLFYNLGDESGIADLAAFWDFDFGDESLVEMRIWLKERYGTLAALNQQWGTSFTSWDLVRPMTTNEAMKRSDDNFSSWADFKAWMDVSFARAVKMGVEAVHSVDPEAYVALEGGQIPGWGGYDYFRLANVLNAMEPYDMGANIEMTRSFNPKMAVVTTGSARGLWEKQRVWYELLHGNRGLILWDDKYQMVGKDAAVGPRGRETAAYYNELRNGIGALMINSEHQSDPIAIHYSQPSLRTEWMLDQRPKGEAWVNRTSSSEERSNFLRLRESYCRLIEDLGLQYNFVSSGQVERGELLRGGYRVFILPHSSALSEAEAKALREFVEQGGVLIADGSPGAFDEHSRRLAQPLLSDLFAGPHSEPVSAHPLGKGKAIYLGVDILSYCRDRLLGKEEEVHQLVARLFKENNVQPAFAVTDQSGQPVVGVETQVFRNGGVNIVGLLSNPQLGVSDLGPPEVISNKRFETPRTVVLTLPRESYVYDLRAGKALGKKQQLTVALDPYEPTLFSVSPQPFPVLTVFAPARLGRGETGRIGMSFSGMSQAALHVFHVDAEDPAGRIVPQYSGNVLAPEGRADKLLPLATNDSTGAWKIRARDLMSGQTSVATIDVF